MSTVVKTYFSQTEDLISTRLIAVYQYGCLEWISGWDLVQCTSQKDIARKIFMAREILQNHLVQFGSRNVRVFPH